MLETERFDRESDNDDRPAQAGHSAEVTQDPAEAGQGQDAADPGSKEAGGRSRGLFRRGRRTATRPAGPPVDDQAGGSAQSSGDQAGGSAQSSGNKASGSAQSSGNKASGSAQSSGDQAGGSAQSAGNKASGSAQSSGDQASG
ncbi:MAG: hypothetical protein WB800_03505, partial [Streptosporangiaceae bacterium]